MKESDIAVVGLAVMGQNLILNMADHGFTVTAWNRSPEKVTEFLSGPAKGKSIRGAFSAPEMVASLSSPRIVFLMVKAGEPVDAMIDAISPLLAKGDIIVDGGNSLYTDTARREKELSAKGLLFVGTGVSGGEEGARYGPSIMPGGAEEAWKTLSPILTAIAARTDTGESCCGWIGSGGSGHAVKMIHNGIEYGDMELITEAWQLLRRSEALSDEAIAAVFADWNRGDLSSYLMEITASILTRRDGAALLVDSILDAAAQKGTGSWTGQTALSLGVPLSLIIEAVEARSLSALKDERVRASSILPGPPSLPTPPPTLVRDVHDALLASKLVSYAQGFMLLSRAAFEYGWQLDLGKIALLWRGGCIIRSSFLNRIRDAYVRDPTLPNLLLDPWFSSLIADLLPGWRRAASWSMLSGIPAPAIASALSFYDGYRTAEGGASLIQAQRDFFGAHTYERKDRPRGLSFHTDWLA